MEKKKSSGKKAHLQGGNMMSKYKNRQDVCIAFVERSSHHLSSQNNSSSSHPQRTSIFLINCNPPREGTVLMYRHNTRDRSWPGLAGGCLWMRGFAASERRRPPCPRPRPAALPLPSAAGERRKLVQRYQARECSSSLAWSRFVTQADKWTPRRLKYKKEM